VAATADLPPGARSRMWILIGLTVAIGIATYTLFGRPIILWVGGLATAVLLYLLAGVELQLARERRELGPIVDTLVRTLEPRGLWIILAANGTVLAMTPAGSMGLAHSSQVLVGQQLADLLPRAPEARVQFAEMLRFASLGEAWSGVIDLADESGARRQHALVTLPVKEPRARRLGLVALAPS
jgi:hypothetical protein